MKVLPYVERYADFERTEFESALVAQSCSEFVASIKKGPGGSLNAEGREIEGSEIPYTPFSHDHSFSFLLTGRANTPSVLCSPLYLDKRREKLHGGVFCF